MKKGSRNGPVYNPEKTRSTEPLNIILQCLDKIPYHRISKAIAKSLHTIVPFNNVYFKKKPVHAEMWILDYTARYKVNGGVLGVSRLFCIQCKCCLEG